MLHKLSKLFFDQDLNARIWVRVGLAMVMVGVPLVYYSHWTVATWITGGVVLIDLVSIRLSKVQQAQTRILDMVDAQSEILAQHHGNLETLFGNDKVIQDYVTQLVAALNRSLGAQEGQPQVKDLEELETQEDPGDPEVG